MKGGFKSFPRDSIPRRKVEGFIPIHPHSSSPFSLQDARRSYEAGRPVSEILHFRYETEFLHDPIIISGIISAIVVQGQSRIATSVEKIVDSPTDTD